MTTFLIIWFGQFVSTVGSGLTGFALSVYIYQQTGSVTQLSLTMLAAVLPRTFVAPFAGVIVDRWDRRWVMLLSDAGAGLSTLVIWVLLATGQLEIWHIYLTNAISAIFGTFQGPAHMATTTQLVPKEHYGRASGLTQLSQAVGRIIAPILAGFLLVTIQIKGVILVDFATFLFATVTLLLIRIPKPEVTKEGEASKGSLLKEALFGWVYLKERPGLLGMLFLFAFINFSLSFTGPLIPPLILSFSTEKVLGIIISVGGAGMVVGSLLMSTWGGSKRKVNSLMGSMFLFGLCISITGIQANPILIGASSFAFFALLPIASGSSQAIWQIKVAPDVQGRVFATRFMLASAATPLAFILSGLLTDNLFEPMMNEGGALASSVGQLIGVGPGRGIGLIFVVMGILITLATLLGYLNPRLRLVEDELPDFVVDTTNSETSPETAVN